MSSASFTVTYTSVYTDSEPGKVFWGADEELSDGGSPRVIVYGYDGLPIQPVAPPSADCIPGPEETQTPPVPQDEDKRYIVESDPEEDPEEYKDDVLEDGLVDYPMDGGDDGDDDDSVLSGDDVDDEEEEEEEGHLASADSAVVVPTVEPISSPEGTEPASISLSPEAEVERLLAMPTPPPSPLTSLSPPSTRVRQARIASTQALIDAVTAALPSPLLPPLPLPLYIPPPVDHGDDIPEIELPPRKKSCLFALGLRYEVDESSTARPTGGRGIDYGFVSTLDAEARRQGIREVGYGIRDTWVDSEEAVPEIAPMTLGEVNTRVTELVELHEHDTHDLYALLEDAQDSSTRISQRVTMDSQRVDLLMKDRIAHQETILITEMAELRETDHRCQAQMVKILRVMGDMRREMGDMQAELLALQEQRRIDRQRIMALVTRRGPNTPPNNNNLNNMTPESVQAMIDQALL
nr:hypothetical protein [Tanacetum cinerariifolium]